MANAKTFYPGATATNTINNATDAALATTATVGNSVDDQNQTPNALVWTGTAVQYSNIGTKDPNTLYFVI
jgi:hypothetical protein